MSPNSRPDAPPTPHNPNARLWQALRQDHMGRFQPLALRRALEDGADPNDRNAKGESPLHYLARHYWSAAQTRALAEALLESGANPNQSEEQEPGESPLGILAQNIIEQSHSPMNAASPQSAQERGEALARLLARHGAGVDLQERNGQSIIERARQSGKGWLADAVLEEAALREAALIAAAARKPRA